MEIIIASLNPKIAPSRTPYMRTENKPVVIDEATDCRICSLLANKGTRHDKTKIHKNTIKRDNLIIKALEIHKAKQAA